MWNLLFPQITKAANAIVQAIMLGTLTRTFVSYVLILCTGLVLNVQSALPLQTLWLIQQVPAIQEVVVNV